MSIHKEDMRIKQLPLCVFIRQAAYPIPRVLKNMEVAKENGFNVTFLGAMRSRSLPREEMWADMSVCRLGIFYPEGSIWYWYLIGTPIFAISVFLWLVKHRSQVIHASDVEGIVGVILYKALGNKARIVFNIHDNFALRYKVPKWLRWIMGRFEAFLGSFADVVLIPDETRLKLLSPWSPKRAIIIPNAPIDPGYSSKRFTGTIRIFAPGWLNWRRGYRALGELVCLRNDVELVVCGSGADDVVRYLKSLPRTELHGFVPMRTVLEIGKSCDIVFAQYDPVFEINKYASSNKVFEAIALGRPVIVNEGIHLAEWVKAKQVGFCVSYDDVTALDKLLEDLLAHPEKLALVGQQGRLLYESEYRWDILKDHVLEALRG